MTRPTATTLVATPARRSLGVAFVDGTLVVVPVFWAFVDLVASVITRGAGRALVTARS